jgi:hypothetical protein
MDPSPRGKESTALEQAVSRAVRDNLALVQHTTKELGQAIEDFVAACGSSRNANMLPSMLRAQTAAASLTSMLDVLSRLLTASLQPARIGASEAYVASLAPAEAPAAEPPAMPPRVVPPVYGEPESAAAAAAAPPSVAPPAAVMAAPAVVEAPPAPPPPAPPAAVETPPPPVVEVAPPEPEPIVESHGGPLVPPETEPAPPREYVPAGVDVAVEAAPQPVAAVEAPPAPEPAAPAVPPVAVFRVEDLPPEQQELHRRANRHAKVSMQDIYLLRPKDVQAARQNKDICVRLRPDIEKARKEYVRRFGPILEHPVDYFYHWMVEVLAEGKPEVLGEYPYPSAAVRR